MLTKKKAGNLYQVWFIDRVHDKRVSEGGILVIVLVIELFSIMPDVTD